MRPIIVWIRRDLRVDDHAALYQATLVGVPVVPLFVFDTELIRRLPSDGAAFNFQTEALAELQKNLKALGGDLITRQGRVLDVHKTLLKELQPQAVYYNRDYEPSAIERDKRVEELYRKSGIEIQSFRDVLVHEPSEVLTGDGKPFVVFTPFANAWKKLSHPSPWGQARRFRTPKLQSDGILGAVELKRKVAIPAPIVQGGERHANRRWRLFKNRKIRGYAENRDLPSVDGTSLMSPYLRFCCISIRKMLEDCQQAYHSAAPGERGSIQKYIDELIWREFYHSVLYHFPRLLESNYRQEFDRMPWTFSVTQFNAWKKGLTGYPLVDAGMRQLNRTGWMHNRVRMVVASFLTKDLRHDWRLGASYFEEKLMDIETASNNGGWQWSASTGVDPKPMRIFNPRLQSERYDPEGKYIRQFVPELAKVPTKYIHAPHEMAPVLQKEICCILGKHYPSPIVDHASASAEYKRLYVALKSRN